MDARARSAGADHFLNKPFTLTQLRSTVSALASKYRPLTAAEEAKIASSKAAGGAAPPIATKIAGRPDSIKVTSSAPRTDAKNSGSEAH